MWWVRPGHRRCGTTSFEHNIDHTIGEQHYNGGTRNNGGVHHDDPSRISRRDNEHDHD